MSFIRCIFTDNDAPRASVSDVLYLDDVSFGDCLVYGNTGEPVVGTWVDLGGNAFHEPDFTIEPDPIAVGEPVTISLEWGRPNRNAYLFLSVRGGGTSYIQPLDISVDLASPHLFGFPVMTDDLGAASVVHEVPARAGYYPRLFFQVAQQRFKTERLIVGVAE